MGRRVVITGLGLVSPVGRDVEESWQATLAGRTGIAPITQFDTSRSTVKIAGEVKEFSTEDVLPAKDSKRISRYIQLAIAAAHEAYRTSGLMGSDSTDRFGCSIGVGIGGIPVIESTAIMMQEKGPQRISPFFIPYVITNMAAGIVANTFKLRGPNICPATACTSGTHAIGEGFLYIKNGLADVMVCGGAESTVCELAVGGFANMKALSRQNDQPELASRPFDRDRDGFVLGEGSGILVLEDYEHAKRRGAKIICEMYGFGMSADAYHITSPAPEGEGAQRCMQAALDNAALNADQIDYINAHGTSTYYNDINETQAISQIFGNHAKELWISSTKGATGHCLGAAGGIEAVFLAKTIAEGCVPPTANLRNPDPLCTLDYVPGSAREKHIRYGLSNSFGFGGTNGSIIFGQCR